MKYLYIFWLSQKHFTAGTSESSPLSGQTCTIEQAHRRAKYLLSLHPGTNCINFKRADTGRKTYQVTQEEHELETAHL